MYNIQGIGDVRESIFFTSDYRFFDEENDRGFDDVRDMNELIIENHNSVVNKRDIVYILGNFSFGNKKETLDILKRLNGRVNLIVGGYDSNGNVLSNKNMLASCNYKLDFKIDDVYITLNSFPQMYWHMKERGAIHLFGSIRGKVPPPHGLCMDVSIDNNDFHPYDWETIKVIMEKKIDYIYYHKKEEDIWI